MVVWITDGGDGQPFGIYEITTALSLVLIIAGTIIAWSKLRLGAILMIIASIALLATGFDDLHFGQIPQILMLASGATLLFIGIFKEPNSTSGI